MANANDLCVFGNIKSVSSIQELSIFLDIRPKSFINAGNELPVAKRDWISTAFSVSQGTTFFVTSHLIHKQTFMMKMNSSFPWHSRQRQSRSWEPDCYRDVSAVIPCLMT